MTANVKASETKNANAPNLRVLVIMRSDFNCY